MPNNVYSSEMEEALISCVLKDSDVFNILKDICNYKDFWFQPYSWIWYAFQKLYDKNSNIDILTLEDEMQRQGTLERFSIFDGTKASLDGLRYLQDKEDVILNNGETYAYQVRDDSSKRKIQEVTNKANDWINEGHSSIDVITNLENELGKVAAYSGVNVKTIMTVGDVVEKAKQEMEYAAKNNVKFIETGIKALDQKIGGLFPQQLIMVAGRSGSGKSSLALTVAMNVSMYNMFVKKVGIFTLEMSSIEYTNRMISAITGIPYLRIKMGKIIDDVEKTSYKEATNIIKNSNNIILDDSINLNIPVMRSKLRKMKESGIELAVIDQLGLISDRTSNEPEHLRIDRLSYQIKNLAREFEIPVILLHQMNRSIESMQRSNNQEPKQTDLDQAGEKPSDLIIMISHKTEQKIIKSSSLWITKNRFGATGNCPVKFESEKTWFRDLTKEELDEMEPDLIK